VRTIFISHSAKSEADQTYLEALATGLEQASFEVWLDRHALTAGDDWNHKIGNHLVYCQGAVVLVSKQSLSSFYVQHEISNLLARWRRERDPRTGEPTFPLCPVLLSPDVEPDLHSGFPQAVRFTDVNYVTPRPVDAALAALRVSFDSLPQWSAAASPLALIEDQIAGLLEGIRLRLLRSAAVTAGFPEPQAVTPEAAALDLTRSLLTRPLNEGYQFLAALGTAITDEQRRNLFQLIAPSWVSPEAARRLSDAIASRPPDVCIVNGERTDFTPQMYLRRARNELPRFAGQVVEVKGVSHRLAWEKLRRDVREAVAVHVGVDLTDPAFEDALRREVTGVLENTKRPLVVAVPVAETDLDIVARLRTETVFEGITFVALCREASPPVGTPGLTWLEPELRPTQEDSAFRMYDRLVRTLA
jgi:hypothetical protein